MPGFCPGTRWSSAFGACLYAIPSVSDLRVGGVWRTDWTYESGSTYGYSSVYLDIAEPERIHYRDCPKDWPGGLDGLPPAELTSTIRLTESAGRTNVHVHVRAASVAHSAVGANQAFVSSVRRRGPGQAFRRRLSFASSAQRPRPSGRVSSSCP